MSQTPQAPEITGRLFLFERPELLNREKHAKLGLKLTDGPYGFAAKTRAIPLTVGEISLAMKDYPIIFTNKENPVPLAVVGIVDDTNLFVKDDGGWEPWTYIPAYVRRYPFAMAAENEGERYAVVIDAACDRLVEGGEVPLFENGEPTEATSSAMEFCQGYEADRRLTETLMKQLADYDLIQPQTAQYTPAGATEQKSFAQYFGVDEQKMKDLPDDKFLELRRSGLLAFCYAQQMSFTNWRDLLTRRAQRFQLTESDVLSPRTVN